MKTNGICGTLTLAGREVARLMRQNRVTIRELAERTGFTQKRIRQVRRTGLSGIAVLDWQEAITGQFTARMRAQLRQWVAAKLN
jgi:hypothetical protein